MITKKNLINILNEFGDAISSLQEGMKVSLRSCNDFRCFRENMHDTLWEIELIKKTITSILMELDEKDEQIEELYKLVKKDDGKRE